jgi:hypothetical protein
MKLIAKVKTAFIESWVRRGRNLLTDLVLAAILLLFVSSNRINLPRLLKLYPSFNELKEGDLFPVRTEVDLRGVEGLLVLALQPTCRYCSESMDFYRWLIEERDAYGLPVKVIVVFPENVGNPSEYLSQQNLVVDRVLTTSFRQLRIKVTPTIFLVDRGMRVLKVWAGKLDPDKEHELLKEMGIRGENKNRYLERGSGSQKG